MLNNLFFRLTQKTASSNDAKIVTGISEHMKEMSFKEFIKYCVGYGAKVFYDLTPEEQELAIKKYYCEMDATDAIDVFYRDGDPSDYVKNFISEKIQGNALLSLIKSQVYYYCLPKVEDAVVEAAAWLSPVPEKKENAND